MSSAWGLVRFPDGRILWGCYNGTSDVFWSGLFEAPESGWPSWKEEAAASERAIDALEEKARSDARVAIQTYRDSSSFSTLAKETAGGVQELLFENAFRRGWNAALEASAVPVDIFSDYGGGTHWQGTASWELKLLVTGQQYGYVETGYSTGFDVPYENGQPDWATDYLRSRQEGA